MKLEINEHTLVEGVYLRRKISAADFYLIDKPYKLQKYNGELALQLEYTENKENCIYNVLTILTFKNNWQLVPWNIWESK